MKRRKKASPQMLARRIAKEKRFANAVSAEATFGVVGA
jgi:hypothetical protein